MSGPVDVDLVIVGAGPAGSAAAVAALRVRPDARVVILDRAPMGRDKVCGDGIAPHAVAELERLGIHAVRTDEIVPTVRLSAPGGASNAAVTASPGYVTRRADLDERMLRAAVEAGAEFRRVKVATIDAGETSVTVNGAYRAPIVIGADGANSVVRRAVGQRSNTGSALAVALRGYVPTPAGLPRELEIRWDSRRRGGLCYAWAFPTSDGSTNVGYGMSSAAITGGRAELVERMRVLLPEFDVAGATLIGHTLPLTVVRPRPAIGRALLVGDAASLINPFTGEGIYSAIASGAMAGEAAMRDPVTAGGVYRRQLAARFGRQYRQTRALYPMLDSTVVLETVIRACQADRRMFDRLLDVGLGDAAFTLADVGRFGRHLRAAG